MPFMKSSLLVVLLALHLVVAQVAATMPACGNDCVAKSASAAGCLLADKSCLCASDNAFISGVLECGAIQCPITDMQNLQKGAAALCGASSGSGAVVPGSPASPTSFSIPGLATPSAGGGLSVTRSLASGSATASGTTPTISTPLNGSSSAIPGASSDAQANATESSSVPASSSTQPAVPSGAVCITLNMDQGNSTGSACIGGAAPAAEAAGAAAGNGALPELRASVVAMLTGCLLGAAAVVW